ncbi:kinase-like protein, partial [Thelephora ganbajun]
HPNVASFLGFCSGSPFSLVYPWMSNGNLSDYLREHLGVDKLGLLIDVAKGLAYMHGLHLVHGDLKGCANILINKNRRACIADFGLSTITGIRILMSFTPGGTYRWMSSELYDPERFGVLGSGSD